MKLITISLVKASVGKAGEKEIRLVEVEKKKKIECNPIKVAGS